VTPKQFVEELASKLRASVPVGALLYLQADWKAQDGLRAFAEAVEKGLDAIDAKAGTVEQLVATLKAKKTEAIGALAYHHKSIEAALAEALRSAEAEARRRAGA
jgi:hypothetical protein